MMTAFEVTAICRRNEEQLDAVLVCTPTHLHAEPTIPALEKNIHVLVENPMAFSTNDANAMIAAAKASKGNLMVGYPRRCDSLWRAVYESIRNGVDADQEKHFGKIDIVIAGDAGVIHAVEGPLGPGGTQIEIISGGVRRQITAEEESKSPASMFIDFITESGENPAPSEECAWAVSLIEASYRSAKEKRIIKIE